MNQSERFSKIQMLLRKHRHMSLDQIKDELEVSSWTCFCDLFYLRDRFNLPIEMDRETGHYFWLDEAPAVVHVEKMPLPAATRSLFGPATVPPRRIIRNSPAQRI